MTIEEFAQSQGITEKDLNKIEFAVNKYFKKYLASNDINAERTIQTLNEMKIQDSEMYANIALERGECRTVPATRKLAQFILSELANEQLTH